MNTKDRIKKELQRPDIDKVIDEIESEIKAEADSC